MFIVPTPYPSIHDADKASHMVLQDLADLLDSTVVVRHCVVSGRQSRTCDAAIRGYPTEKYRVIVTLANDGSYNVRARPR